MTKIAIMSDLHLEFEQPWPRPRTRAWADLAERRATLPDHPLLGPLLADAKAARPDLILLAGDIDVGTRGIRYAADVARYLDAPVVAIAGNHEFYDGTDLPLLVEQISDAAAATHGLVTFLEQDAVTICGHRILGATSWTDYELHGSPEASMATASALLSDHGRIMLAGELFTPADARDLHQATMTWLHSTARPGGIIVTHHAPIGEANPPQYRAGNLAPAFASDLTNEILTLQPSLWISGHTHHDHDITIGSTRLVSAQRGYVCSGDGAERFQPRIIEL